MKRTFMVVVTILLNLNIYSQSNDNSDSNIFGDVKSSGKHIPFVTIVVKGTNIVTMTDATGHYKLVNLEPGEHTITAYAFGYLKKEQKIIIENAKTIELNFELEEDLIGIEEVVISSDRDAVDRKSSGVIVNSINTKVFALTNSISLSDGLDFTAGLRTECNCQNCGFTQIRMNGMEGPYSQILINGHPIFSGLAGVYGLELFPSNMIKKVEVVRGGGSALYGGNAIAGTINIITKEPVTNSFGLSTNYAAIGIGHEEVNELTFDKSLNFNASVISDDLKNGLSLFGMIRSRDPYDENGDGFSEEVLLKNQTIGINTFYKPTTRIKINLDLYKIHEFRRGGDQFDKLPHETLITEQLEHDIIGGNIGLDILTASSHKFSFYSAGQSVKRQSYYGSFGDPNAYGKTGDISTSTGFQYTGKFDFISGSKIIVGIDHTFNKLDDEKLGTGGLENITISNQLVNTVGSFLQYDLTIGKFKLSAGIRYDNYQINDKAYDQGSLSGNALVPRANILINLDHVQFRASFAKGYRAPQIYDEDLHIETSGLRRIIHDNSSDLVQENSDSFSGSVIFDDVLGFAKPIQFEFIAEAFYTKLNKPFVNELSDPDEFGNVLYLRKNAERGAYVYGINFEASIAFSKKIITQIGYTQQKSLFEEPQQWGEEEEHTLKEFLRTPDSYGFFTFEIIPTKAFKFYISGIYTGSMYVPHLGTIYGDSPFTDAAIDQAYIIEGEKLEHTGNFLNMGCKISYDITINKYYKVRLNAGMKNILDQTQHDHDKGVFRDAGYIYGPHQSRSIFFGIEIGTGI